MGVNSVNQPTGSGMTRSADRRCRAEMGMGWTCGKARPKIGGRQELPSGNQGVGEDCRRGGSMSCLRSQEGIVSGERKSGRHGNNEKTGRKTNPPGALVIIVCSSGQMARLIVVIESN